MKWPKHLRNAGEQLKKAVWEFAINHTIKAFFGFLAIFIFSIKEKVVNLLAGVWWKAMHIWGYFWPPSDKQVWMYWILFFGILFLLALIAYQGWVRIEDPNAKNKARDRRRNEKSKRTQAARKKNPNAPSATINETFIGETWRDPIVRKSVYSCCSVMLSIMLLINLLATNLVSLSAQVNWRSTETPSEVFIAIRGIETAFITSGRVDPSGVSYFYRRVPSGEYRGVAYRIKKGQVQWSEIHIRVEEGTHTTVELNNFPQYQCNYSPLAAVQFRKPGEWDIHKNDNALLSSHQLTLQNFDGLVLVEGRADDTQYPHGSQQNNFWLSCQRCDSVIERLSAVVHDKFKLISAPLGEYRPLTDGDRAKERSVLLIPLQRLLF